MINFHHTSYTTSLFSRRRLLKLPIRKDAPKTCPLKTTNRDLSAERHGLSDGGAGPRRCQRGSRQGFVGDDGAGRVGGHEGKVRGGLGRDADGVPPLQAPRAVLHGVAPVRGAGGGGERSVTPHHRGGSTPNPRCHHSNRSGRLGTPAALAELKPRPLGPPGPWRSSLLFLCLCRGCCRCGLPPPYVAHGDEEELPVLLEDFDELRRHRHPGVDVVRGGRRRLRRPPATHVEGLEGEAGESPRAAPVRGDPRAGPAVRAEQLQLLELGGQTALGNHHGHGGRPARGRLLLESHTAQGGTHTRGGHGG